MLGSTSRHSRGWFLLGLVGCAVAGGGSRQVAFAQPSTTPPQSIKCCFVVKWCDREEEVICWYCTPDEGAPTPTCAPMQIRDTIQDCIVDFWMGCSGGTIV